MYPKMAIVGNNCGNIPVGPLVYFSNLPLALAMKYGQRTKMDLWNYFCHRKKSKYTFLARLIKYQAHL